MTPERLRHAVRAEVYHENCLEGVPDLICQDRTEVGTCCRRVCGLAECLVAKGLLFSQALDSGMRRFSVQFPNKNI